MAGPPARVRAARHPGGAARRREGAARRVVAALDLAPRHRPVAVVAGGETTVRVVRGGRGGRSQHLALTAALALVGRRGSCSPRAPTDRRCTDVAGACVDGETVARARARGSDAVAALAATDSNLLLAASGISRHRAHGHERRRPGGRAPTCVLVRRGMAAQTASVSELFGSFQGEGAHAGRRQLCVRFAGCPLRCRWCDTPDSLVPVSECRILGVDGARVRPSPLTVAELDAEVRALHAASPPVQGDAVTGGEPLSQAESRHVAARPVDLPPVLLETAGILPRGWSVLPYVAIVSLDFASEQYRRAGALGRARGVLHCRRGPRRLREDAGGRHDRARGGRARRAPRGQRRARCPLFLPADGGRERVADRRRHPGALAALASRHHPDVRAAPAAQGPRHPVTPPSHLPVQLIIHIARR